MRNGDRARMDATSDRSMGHSGERTNRIGSLRGCGMEDLRNMKMNEASTTHRGLESNEISGRNDTLSGRTRGTTMFYGRRY